MAGAQNIQSTIVRHSIHDMHTLTSVLTVSSGGSGQRFLSPNLRYCLFSQEMLEHTGYTPFNN